MNKNFSEAERLWEEYVKTRSNDIKNELIMHYLPLVKTTAIKLCENLPKHIDINDLISSGVRGLIDSIEKFDPKTGHKFKTFSNLRIYGSMLDDLRNMDWVPRSVRTKAKKLQSAYNAVQQAKGRYATDNEVAEYLDISIEEFNSLIESTRIVTFISLDAKLQNSKSNDFTSYSDFIEDPSVILPHQTISKKEQKDILIKAIEKLNEKEKSVLTLYYFEDLTLREIGEVLGITESRVSQIHSKAIFHLRSRLNTSEVADYASH